MTPGEILAAQQQEIQNWGTPEDLVRQAEDHSARRFGFESADEMAEWIAQTRGRTVDDYQGLGEQEMALHRQQLHSQTEMMMAQMERAIDAVAGETGSSMRAFAAADDARRQISDHRINYQMGVMQADVQRRQLHFQTEQQQMQMMVEQGAVTTQQYVSWVHTDRALTMQSWASQMEQTLAGFQQDRAAVNEYIANMETVINMDLGLRTAIDRGMDKAYERHMRPAMANIEAAMMQLSTDSSFYEAMATEHFTAEAQRLGLENIQAQKAANASNGFLGFLGIIMKFALGAFF